MELRKLFFLLSLVTVASAAQDTILPLEEVRISDTQLRNFSRSKTVIVLNDSVIGKNGPSLTSLLNYNSTIYFKENGAGMVASPSFRGTTASQTAVVWNGIGVNSQLNGQTDFNTALSGGFDAVSVRAGGGSVVYGSSAVGGTIHLDNVLSYGKKSEQVISGNYGSFGTYGGRYRFSAGDEKWNVSFSALRNGSENNYDLPGSRKNENGQFYNNGGNVAAGFRPNANNEFRFYSQVFDGQRYFSVLHLTDTRTKYEDFNARNMLEWIAVTGRFTSKVKAAYLTERYRYYGNIASPDYATGQVTTVLGRYDATYDFNPKIKLNAIFDLSESRGKGSDIEEKSRVTGSGALLFRHLVSAKFEYEAGIRKEAVSTYESPELFSAGTSYRLLKNYHIKANLSKNFRVPTFNDLYWTGSGNPDLLPETALQWEVGNEFLWKNGKIAITGYDGKIRDMIRWKPTSGGFFSPENVDRVRIRGIEILAHLRRKCGKLDFSFDGTYAYTESKNEKTGNQLPYVPYHKATASAGMSYAATSFVYQHLFTGEVYLQSDNDPGRKLDAYNVSNILIDHDFGKLQAGFRACNIWNEGYQSVEGRFMPKRHYSLNLTLIF